jgi:hypothetical protein
MRRGLSAARRKAPAKAAARRVRSVLSWAARSAPVSAVVGAVDGVLGIPHRHWRHGCRGFYDRYNRFHCYR